ncbi:MAG TPA: MmoB/DmpM family protein [Kofleriaceae bacterium]|nr:MmoB/DmpM family protein [Kofleriaceae bacterium]
MTDRSEHAEWVGPVLEAGELADAIIESIRDTHPTVVVEDRESYLRVLVRSPCVLRRAEVERRTGRPFTLPVDLEQIMPSFKGRLAIGADEVVWAMGPPGGRR